MQNIIDDIQKKAYQTVNAALVQRSNAKEKIPLNT